jgi:SET domain-containing protein
MKTSTRPTAYLSPKLEARHHLNKGGFGVFAKASIRAGEVVVAWGGDVLTAKEFAALPTKVQQHSLQIEDDLYLVPSGADEPADYVNHSCAPNVGMRGQIVLVALRHIAAGEEVCFDYAMSDGGPYDEFDCACGMPNCRGKITGNDWKRPELWERYAGYFSPYLQRRIDRLKASLPDHSTCGK